MKRKRLDRERYFPCGHIRRLDNVHRYSMGPLKRNGTVYERTEPRGERCRICYNAYMARYMTRRRKAGKDKWVKRRGWRHKGKVKR